MTKVSIFYRFIDNQLVPTSKWFDNDQQYRLELSISVDHLISWFKTNLSPVKAYRIYYDIEHERDDEILHRRLVGSYINWRHKIKISGRKTPGAEVVENSNDWDSFKSFQVQSANLPPSPKPKYIQSIMLTEFNPKIDGKLIILNKSDKIKYYKLVNGQMVEVSLPTKILTDVIDQMRQI